MIRILQVVNDMHRAGLETMLMNYYRTIDKTKIQFDFLTHRPYSSDYDLEILSMGGKIYHAPRLYPQNYLSYFRFMRTFFEEHTEYLIVHAHIDTMSYLPLHAAKMAGVPVRIAHSHNTSIDLDWKFPLKYFFKSQLQKEANYYCACGEKAGEFLFHNHNFKVIYNAISAEQFRFSDNLRKSKRSELNIKDEFVVGHVGRLSHQKNHEFLIKVFYELVKSEPNALLLLIGTGKKEKMIRRLVKKYKLETRVRFLGNRSDVNELYQVMDVFLLPSRFEGIPLVGIEAQFSGLPCVFSTNIPSEVAFSQECTFISLKKSASEWAKVTLKLRDHIRNRSTQKILCRQYEIESAAKELEIYYLSFQTGGIGLPN